VAAWVLVVEDGDEEVEVALLEVEIEVEVELGAELGGVEVMLVVANVSTFTPLAEDVADVPLC